MKSIMFPPKFGDKVQKQKVKPLLSFGAEMEVDDPMGEPVLEKVAKPKKDTKTKKPTKPKKDTKAKVDEGGEGEGEVTDDSATE